MWWATILLTSAKHHKGHPIIRFQYVATLKVFSVIGLCECGWKNQMQSDLSALALQPEFESEELVIFVCEKQCNNSTKISSATIGLSEPAFSFHCSKWKIAKGLKAGHLGVKVPSCLCYHFVHSLILTGNKRPVLHSSKQIFKYASFIFSLPCYCHFNTIWLHICLAQ